MKQPFGVILAGGRGARMHGADKARLALGGRAMWAHVHARLAPQVAQIALNANGDAARFNGAGLPILPDDPPDFAGPLAGVLAGLDWAAKGGASHIVTAATDTPFFPCDLVPRLLLAAPTEATPVIAAIQEEGQLRPQPTFGLWPVSLRAALRAALGDGVRKVLHFAMDHGGVLAEFPAEGAPFFNINTPEDLAQAERRL